MQSSCSNCHWYKPDREYAHVINCLEHFDYHDKTDTCDSFCENGKYEPTGIWARVAELMQAVAKEVEKQA